MINASLILRALREYHRFDRVEMQAGEIFGIIRNEPGGRVPLGYLRHYTVIECPGTGISVFDRNGVILRTFFYPFFERRINAC